MKFSAKNHKIPSPLRSIPKKPWGHRLRAKRHCLKTMRQWKRQLQLETWFKTQLDWKTYWITIPPGKSRWRNATPMYWFITFRHLLGVAPTPSTFSTVYVLGFRNLGFQAPGYPSFGISNPNLSCLGKLWWALQFHPDWGNDPIWQAGFFQISWIN